MDSRGIDSHRMAVKILPSFILYWKKLCLEGDIRELSIISPILQACTPSCVLYHTALHYCSHTKLPQRDILQSSLGEWHFNKIVIKHVTGGRKEDKMPESLNLLTKKRKRALRLSSSHTIMSPLLRAPARAHTVFVTMYICTSMNTHIYVASQEGHRGPVMAGASRKLISLAGFVWFSLPTLLLPLKGGNNI